MLWLRVHDSGPLVGASTRGLVRSEPRHLRDRRSCVQLPHPAPRAARRRQISGACRGEEKAEALRAHGIGAFEWDPDNDTRLSCVGGSSAEPAASPPTCVPCHTATSSGSSVASRPSCPLCPVPAAPPPSIASPPARTSSPPSRPSPTSTGIRRAKSPLTNPSSPQPPVPCSPCTHPRNPPRLHPRCSSTTAAISSASRRAPPAARATRCGGSGTSAAPPCTATTRAPGWTRRRRCGSGPGAGRRARGDPLAERTRQSTVVVGAASPHAVTFLFSAPSPPPRPTTAQPWTRAQAERAWQALHSAHGVPVHTFRLAGIYGARMRQLVAGAQRTDRS